MKRLAGVILVFIVLYAVYNDLNYGTLPAMTTDIPATTQPYSASDLPYFEKKVMAGDTVLSILEKHLDHSIPVPLSKIVTDFEELNEGISPQEIQSGKIYKFPDYQNEQ